ncbi:SagB/ThcOx family dehydrogenase [Dictyoglomus thermophilum]|uniref:Nitroreductase n=1 Tax=Dictyoglomus thermophilum (strain ATCC 35947 / DSM 3960 / H-6-12) TaxID=309799 RepID=B5YA56_DICT6|nr:SagB family peptide dehydrogenase [Dictyoglomus thermophilum]ACI20059.1 nitroreductase [Dictyoglomus thermophilum H-6-12]
MEWIAMFILIIILLIRFTYANNGKTIKLPSPLLKSSISIEEALLLRRSKRFYKDNPLTLQELSQILWASQGISDPDYKFRTCPSAGALYPLEIYVSVLRVDGIESGIYKYNPEKHEIVQIYKSSKREELYEASLKQEWIKRAPVVIIICASFYKTKARYGERGIRYIYIETGHCAQNIYLQCVSLNLGTVAIGAFDDDEIKRILNLPKFEFPTYLMPIGKI